MDAAGKVSLTGTSLFLAIFHKTTPFSSEVPPRLEIGSSPPDARKRPSGE